MTLIDPTTQQAPFVDPAVDAETWTAVCALDALLPERGAAALVAGEQIALFRLHDGGVRAVQQADPYADHANVMSRGLVGQRGGRDTVASPMYKHVFDLADGACLDSKGAEPIALRCWPVRVADGLVLVGLRQDEERAA